MGQPNPAPMAAPDHPDDRDDDALMACVAGGDERAFEELALRHEPRVRRYLTRMVGSADADDLVQDVFTTLWRERARYQPSGRLDRYLYGVARHRALRHLRWRKLKWRWARHDVEVAMDARALRSLLDDERGAALHRLLGGLPMPMREAVILHYAEGLGYRDIAALLGAPEATVRVRAHRGLAALRERMARWEETR